MKQYKFNLWLFPKSMNERIVPFEVEADSQVTAEHYASNKANELIKEMGYVSYHVEPKGAEIIAEVTKKPALMGKRMPLRLMPNTAHHCPKLDCIYNGLTQRSICDNPRINKGNSDAYCFKLNNITVYQWLTNID